MSAQADFHYSIDRAGNSVLDATCTCRAAGVGPLPQPHRRLLSSAIRKLESAQDDLFKLREHPWQSARPAKAEQLELLSIVAGQ